MTSRRMLAEVKRTHYKQDLTDKRTIADLATKPLDYEARVAAQRREVRRRLDELALRRELDALA